MAAADFGAIRINHCGVVAIKNTEISNKPIARDVLVGQVYLNNTVTGTGNTVVIDHGCGVRSYLYGLQELSVTRGQTVERGQAVGVLGEELTMDFKLGSKSVNPWMLFQTSGGLFWKENS